MDIPGATTLPAPPSKPNGFLAYANVATSLKRHYPIKSEPRPLPLTPAPVSYRECMHNHAAAIGGHALDGCCEFMPEPIFSDQTSLRCAACGCHRNFHRRDPDGPAPLHNSFPAAVDSPSSPHTPATLSSGPQTLSPAANGAGGGGGKRSSTSGSSGKKRFRTKFSRDQKAKMYEFAGRFGWKMQKMDKSVVEEFCGQIGVGKEVLKIWLHNNKNTLGKNDGDGHFSSSGYHVD